MTEIEWTHKPGYKGVAWNPVSGCTKVSPGCKHCYAETMHNRFWAKDRPFTQVVCHEDRLDIPLKWRKPRMVFVNSMSDLFHEDVPDEFVEKVFNKMWQCPEHTFIILTKRPERMEDWCRSNADLIDTMKPGEIVTIDQLYYDNLCGYSYIEDRNDCTCNNGYLCNHPDIKNSNYNCECGKSNLRLCYSFNCPIATSEPHKNDFIAHLGDKGAKDFIESYGLAFDDEGYSEEHTDDPIMRLDSKPYGVRVQNVWLGVSCEDQKTADERIPILMQTPAAQLFISLEPLLEPINITPYIDELDWVIVGGESGLGARPCAMGWIQNIVEQCQSSSTPVFVKQTGTWLAKSLKYKNDKKGSNPENWDKSIRLREWPK